MRADKKSPLKSDKKSPSKVQKKGTIGYNKKSALLEDAITQMNAGKYGRASAALKDLLGLDPLNAEARRLFATLHLRLGSLMSARTAFESLAREAMERQDYWLAESLLREYLTAGPRCVPFLEMLGRVYEEKGDVMAAVAEYGKALEVLLEDPDAENPNRASELFARIRSVAPGSPVAFRFAAMFDTVTGQVLPATPEPAAVDSTSETSHSAAVRDSPSDTTSAVVMPWEQVEPPSTDAPLEQEPSVPTAEHSTEAIEARGGVTPFVSSEVVTEVEQQNSELDQARGMQAADSSAERDCQVPADSSRLPAAEPVQFAGQNEPPVLRLSHPMSGEAESSSPLVDGVPPPPIEALTQSSSHPLGEAPASQASMPRDQVEDVGAVIPPPPLGEAPIVAEVVLLRSGETETPPPPSSSMIDELPSLATERLEQASSRQIAEAPASQASMPWDQVEEVGVVIPPAPVSEVPVAAEVVSLHSGERELPPSPVGELQTPTIEILTQASHQPIAEAPTSPAPMPWDQVEDTTSAVFPIAEPDIALEGVGSSKAIEPIATNHLTDAVPPTQLPASAPASEIISSGLSWEDILAAVTAMQAAPAPAETLSSTRSKPFSEIVIVDEPSSTTTASSDPVETEVLLLGASASDTFVGQVSEPPLLSAPMPWEQIEVDDLTIPRQEPEPEFGAVSSDTGEGVQDATLVLPRVPETPETGTVVGTLTDIAGPDSYVPIAATPRSEFGVLSPDATVEASIHPIPIPVEAYEPVDPPAPDVVPEDEPATECTTNDLVEQPLRVAGSDSSAAPKRDEPPAMPVEPVTGFAIAATNDVLPLSSKEADAPALQTQVGESTEAIVLECSPQVDEPVEEVLVREVGAFPIQQTEIDATPLSVAPALLEEQRVLQVEPATTTAQDAASPAQEMSPVEDQEHASISEAEVGEVASPPLSKSFAPVTEASLSPVLPVPEAGLLQPDMVVNDAPAQEAVLTFAESAQVTESAPVAGVLEVQTEPAASPDPRTTSPGHPAPPMPTPGESVRILWDEASSAPAPTASTGNMLTRWLKKPADVPPAKVSEANHPTTVLHEPPAPLEPLPVEQPDAISVVTDHPVDRSDGSKSGAIDESVIRPKPSQVATGRVWRHLGGTLCALVGAGVSTTRSLVVLVLALVGLSLVVLAGAVAGIALMWMVLEEQPTIAYRNMTSVPQRTLEGSGKNGYLLLLGFGAAATQDPVQVGMERRVAGEDRAFAHTCLAGEGSGSGSQQGASVEVAGKWMKTADPAAQMRLEANGVKSWVSRAEVSVSRYRQWLTRPFEDWGYGEPISPNCGLILYAHRLYVAEGFTQDVEVGIARLETDLTAWRTVLGQAKTMPVKMLASDALNDDIMVMGGLLLRPELDERLISRLAKLARPLDQAEQSIRWPMQSQFVLATKLLDEAISQDRADARPFYGSVAAALPLPKQRRFNAYAQYYEAAGKAAGEGRYADLPKRSQFVHVPPYGLGDLFMNPIESLVGIDPLPTWETYAGRVLETDARLRLASLQAWLRRTPAEQDLMTRIAKAGQGLYDPFTGFPMLVNAKKGVLYSVGRDSKDNEAQERFDVVVQIPPTAWVGGRRPADANK